MLRGSRRTVAEATLVELWYELDGLCHVFLFVDRSFRGVLVLAREDYESMTVRGWRMLADQIEKRRRGAGEAEQHNQYSGAVGG